MDGTRVVDSGAKKIRFAVELCSMDQGCKELEISCISVVVSACYAHESYRKSTENPTGRTRIVESSPKTAVNRCKSVYRDQ